MHEIWTKHAGLYGSRFFIGELVILFKHLQIKVSDKIFRRAYILGGLIFGREFLLVIREAYIGGGLIFAGGLYLGFYGISK